MQLFNEITACKAKMVEYTAEIKTLKEKLAVAVVQTSTSHQAPASAVSPYYYEYFLSFFSPGMRCAS